jgi:hypothetical protein
MGQIATLYRIAKVDFLRLVENPANLGLLNQKTEYISFQKTFDGFCFLLSKGQNKAIAELVNQIFYPVTHVGKEINFENFDIENIPDDFDFESTAIYYNDPGNVTKIATFLDSITIENFKELFNVDELNEHGIYPTLWNTKTGEDEGFNISHMEEEFVEMKQFFLTAKEEGDYVLSFIE